MSFLAGETITAARLNRLQAKTYRAVCSVALSGPATSADVPGATITLTTEANNAIYVASCIYDYRIGSGTPTTLGSGNLSVDGVLGTEFSMFRDGGGSLNTSMTVAQTYRGTLGTAGSHTLKLVASPASGHQVNIYSSITVTIYEVA